MLINELSTSVALSFWHVHSKRCGSIPYGVGGFESSDSLVGIGKNRIGWRMRPIVLEKVNKSPVIDHTLCRKNDGYSAIRLLNV